MIRVVLILLIFTGIYQVSGQGCGDAGACSAGSLGLHESGQNETRFWMGYAQSIGLADKESLVLSTDLTINHRLFPNTGLEVRIPYLVTIGNLGTTSGPGDLLVSLSQVVFQEEKSAFSIVAGGRIKTNESDKEMDGEPLPMVYQSSLGTHDIFAGIAWHSGDWSLSLAYQHPFGSNKNEYLRPDTMEIPENKQYFESAFLKRGDDLVLRFQRAFNIHPAGQVVAGILPVYRIQQDEIRGALGGPGQRFATGLGRADTVPSRLQGGSQEEPDGFLVIDDQQVGLHGVGFRIPSRGMTPGA